MMINRDRNAEEQRIEPWADGVAIVGMSARFPGARNVREFQQKLLAGESFLSDLSAEELLAAGVDEATLRRPEYVRRGGRLEDADAFDAKFFGYNRREAEITDPQHRVLLETAWEALEDAGYVGAAARIGVFAGVSMNTYFYQMVGDRKLWESAGGYQLMVGNDKDFLATRIAYKLDLRGPAVVVQTACSTSLAAVHAACRSLLANECTMALAGGASIAFPQGLGYLHVPGMILSPDGYCRPFDRKARGTVPGQGAAIVVLKRLAKALVDRDSIYAVIRGSAWNNDGARKVGYTAPSVEGQAAVVREAQAAAGVAASRIGYIEAHGTATELGDPIEVAALAEVFAGVKPGSCVLGALKANLGHADVTAGVAGLIKTALTLQAGVIPPTPHFEEPNPALRLQSTPFVVSAQVMPWPQSGERWAGVSSFGIGGTNVHVVLSQAPAGEALVVEEQERLFVVSARTESALARARERLAAHLEEKPEIDLAAVASTLQMGRKAFEHRFATVTRTADELVVRLRAPLKEASSGGFTNAGLVFLFPGQGQQFLGMGAGLYAKDAAFQKTIDAGAALLRDEFGLDVVGMIAGAEPTPSLRERMMDTEVAQPLLFLVEYALAERWISLGAEPGALLGHSLGELTAAAVAGMFSFEDGLRLAAQRGRLMEQTPPGVMLAVILAPDALGRYLSADTWLAAENGPKITVVAGLTAAIEALEEKLAGDRVASMRLASKKAFHTPLMAGAAKAFREKVAAVTRREPEIPWLSNVTGTWIAAAEAQDPQYWANQIVSRVRFARCVATLREQPRILLEVGPGEILAGMARSAVAKSVALPSIGAENRRNSDDVVLLESAGRMWQAGVDLRWAELPGTRRPRRVSLPTYPFERERYTITPSPGAAMAKRPNGVAEEMQPAATERLIGKRSPAAPEQVTRETDVPVADVVAEIWSELLGNPEVGPDDNFFELGGDSLLGTMVLSRVRERCRVELTLRALFEAPTPQELAERIRLSRSVPVETIPGRGKEREKFEI